MPLPGPLPGPYPFSRDSTPLVMPGRNSGSATATATPKNASRRPAADSGDGSQTSTPRPSPVNRRPNRRTRSTLSVTSSQRNPSAPMMNGIGETLSTWTNTGTA